MTPSTKMPLPATAIFEVPLWRFRPETSAFNLHKRIVRVAFVSVLTVGRVPQRLEYCLSSGLGSCCSERDRRSSLASCSVFFPRRLSIRTHIVGAMTNTEAIRPLTERMDGLEHNLSVQSISLGSGPCGPYRARLSAAVGGLRHRDDGCIRRQRGGALEDRRDVSTPVKNSNRQSDFVSTIRTSITLSDPSNEIVATLRVSFGFGTKGVLSVSRKVYRTSEFPLVETTGKIA